MSEQPEYVPKPSPPDLAPQTSANQGPLSEGEEVQNTMRLIKDHLRSRPHDEQAQFMRRLLATIAQRDALIEELRARVKELEDRVTSWEQDALRGSTGLAAWDWG